jgi:hypothetical protein
MRYFKNAAGAVYGYDETDPSGVALIAAALDAKWTDVTAVWPPTMTAVEAQAAKWLAYQQQARAALLASDTTMHRCVENQVAVPAAWATYRKALRAIISAPTGDPTLPPPTRPAYPAGT